MKRSMYHMHFVAIGISVICAIISGLATFTFWRQRSDRLIKARRPRLVLAFGCLTTLTMGVLQPIILIADVASEYWVKENKRMTVINFGTELVYECCFVTMLGIILARCWLLLYDHNFARACIDRNWRVAINAGDEVFWLSFRRTFGNGVHLMGVLAVNAFGISVICVAIAYLSHHPNVDTTTLITRFGVGLPLLLGTVRILRQITDLELVDEFFLSHEMRLLASVLIFDFIRIFLYSILRNAWGIQDLYRWLLDMATSVALTLIQTMWVRYQGRKRMKEMRLSGFMAGMNALGRKMAMHDVLKEKLGFEYFMRHCQQELAVENVLFLTEVAQFRETLVLFKVPEHESLFDVIDVFAEHDDILPNPLIIGGSEKVDTLGDQLTRTESFQKQLNTSVTLTTTLNLAEPKSNPIPQMSSAQNSLSSAHSNQVLLTHRPKKPFNFELAASASSGSDGDLPNKMSNSPPLGSASAAIGGTVGVRKNQAGLGEIDDGTPVPTSAIANPIREKTLTFPKVYKRPELGIADSDTIDAAIEKRDFVRIPVSGPILLRNASGSSSESGGDNRLPPIGPTPSPSGQPSVSGKKHSFPPNTTPEPSSKRLEDILAHIANPRLGNNRSQSIAVRNTQMSEFQSNILHRDWLPISFHLRPQAEDIRQSSTEATDDYKRELTPRVPQPTPDLQRGGSIGLGSRRSTKTVSFNHGHDPEHSVSHSKSKSKSKSKTNTLTHDHTKSNTKSKTKSVTNTQKLSQLSRTRSNRSLKKIMSAQSKYSSTKKSEISMGSSARLELDITWLFCVAQHLYYKYVHTDAELCVNISSVNRIHLDDLFRDIETGIDFITGNAIGPLAHVLFPRFAQQASESGMQIVPDIQSMVGTYLYHVFDMAFEEVWCLLRDDSFIRFQNSEAFIRYLQHLSEKKKRKKDKKKLKSIKARRSKSAGGKGGLGLGGNILNAV